MTIAQVKLPSYYISQIVAQVEQSGFSIEGWLSHIGLTSNRLNEALVELSFLEFRQLFIDALAITKEPALGLLIGARLQAQTHGVLSYAAMSGGSIRQVIELLQKFVLLRQNLLEISHQQVNDEMVVRFSELLPLGDIGRTVLEAIVLAIKNILDFITMGACRINQVAFAAESASCEALASEMFDCPVQYGMTWTGFTLPLSVVDLPLRLADPAVFQDAARICEEALAQRHERETLSAKIHRLMLQKQSDFPSLVVTSRIFHMTPRTLHRRLEEEGTSFREIQEEVRHALAVEYLKAGRLSIQEIAYTLGYTEIASFRRAFKRWENVAPSQYQKSP